MSILSTQDGIDNQGIVQDVVSSIGSQDSIMGLITGGLSYNTIEVTILLISRGIIFAVFIISFRY
jgi:hypothetical protein